MISANDDESIVINVENDSKTMSFKKVQAKFEKIRKKEFFRKTKKTLLKKRIKKIANFSMKSFSIIFVTFDFKSIETNQMTMKKNFFVIDFEKYTKKSQTNYERFLKKCENTFETRLMTYRDDTNKIRYDQQYFKGQFVIE